MHRGPHLARVRSDALPETQGTRRLPVRLRRGSGGEASEWPPSYQTIGWEAALDDLEARFGNVAEILAEPALREVEESTRPCSRIFAPRITTRFTGPPILCWRAYATWHAA